MLLSKEMVGKRIAGARKSAHMTQAELAERINISEKYLSRIERGKQLPSIEIVAKICEMLGVSADELLLPNQSQNINGEIQNELAGFSVHEKIKIIEIIKIIKEFQKRT